MCHSVENSSEEARRRKMFTCGTYDESAGGALRSDPAIAMMQSAYDGDRDELCRTRDRDCYFGGDGRFPFKSLMGP